MTSTEALIVLNMLRHVGPVRVRGLIEVLGSPEAILSASADRLRAVHGVGDEVAEAIRSWSSSVDLDAELREAARVGATIVTSLDPAYPDLLREIHDPPIVLYVRGTLPVSGRRCVGVVGTRKPSHYAAECTKKLSYQMAFAGLTVVSGLARGVDTAAHQAALAARGRTVAVLGSGLSCLYPPENRELAEKITSFGAVVSEFSMRTKADRQTFPMRNRIISGMSFGLLVTEAGARSGALISATRAAEQGRAVYAVPGRIDQPGAEGSNNLIQSGAKLVQCAEDILNDFGLLFATPPVLQCTAPPVELTGVARVVYDALGNDEESVDSLVAKCGLPTAEVSSTLLALEMRRLVKALPGARFVKIH